MNSSSLSTVDRFLTLVALLLCGCALAGCDADMTTNGSFDIAPDQAKAYLREIREDRRSLERPVIVLSGFMDPGFIATSLKSRLKRAFDDDRILAIQFAATPDFQSARRRVIDKVDAKFPSDDEHETVEVDVIAHSMGGLIARYAAMPIEGSRRLRVARIFTIATPHGGAELADLPTWHKLQIDMREGSEFLASLNAAWPERDYELLPYVRLGDYVIGSENAAPPGQLPWWVDNPPLNLPHMGAQSDPRILGDIFRRLRGEEPYTREPREPLPDDQKARDDDEHPDEAEPPPHSPDCDQRT